MLAFADDKCYSHVCTSIRYGKISKDNAGKEEMLVTSSSCFFSQCFLKSSSLEPSLILLNGYLFTRRQNLELHHGESFANEKFSVTKMTITVLERIENMMGNKGYS